MNSPLHTKAKRLKTSATQIQQAVSNCASTVSGGPLTSGSRTETAEAITGSEYLQCVLTRSNTFLLVLLLLQHCFHLSEYFLRPEGIPPIDSSRLESIPETLDLFLL